MFSMNATRAQLAVLAFVTLLSQGRPARSEVPTSAEQLFQEGRAALADDDYELARSHFEQSYKLDPALGTLLNLAVCEEKSGKLKSALAHLQEALHKAGAEDQRRPLVVQRIARLDSRIPRLTIRPSRPFEPSVNLSLDAKPLGMAEIGRTLRVDPGTHVFDCAGPNGERCTIVFTLEEGQESVLVPTLSAPSAPARPPPVGSALAASTPAPPMAPKQRAGAERAFAFAAGGFGLASIVAGLIAGAGVLHQKDLMAAHCDERGCDDEGIAAAERGKTLSTVSTLATGIGVVVMGASVVVLISAPSSKDSAAALSFAGSF
jgi:hypothetical protein